MFFKTLATKTIERDEKSLQSAVKKNLLDDIEAFRNDLLPNEYVSRNLREIDTKLGFQSFMTGARHPRTPVISGEFLPVLRKTIESQFDCPVVSLFLSGPDSKDVWWAIAASFSRRLEVTADELQNAFICANNQSLQEPFRYPQFVKDLLEKKKEYGGGLWSGPADVFYQKTFGPAVFAEFIDKTALLKISERLENERMYFYFTRIKESSDFFTGKIHGSYQVAILEKDLSLRQLFRRTRLNSRYQGFKRFISGTLSPPDGITCMETPRGLMVLDVMPLQTMDLIRSKPNETSFKSLHQRVLQGTPPIIGVIAPSSAFEHPLRKYLSGYTTVAWILIIMSGFLLLLWKIRGTAPFLNVRAKLALAVSLAIFLPLSGFLMAALSGAYFQSRIQPEEVLDKLDRRLNAFEEGMDGFETFLGARLFRLRENLAKVIDSEREEVQRTLKTWLDEGTAFDMPGSTGVVFSPRSFYLHRNDDSDWHEVTYKVSSPKDVEGIKMERGICLEKLFLIGGFKNLAPAIQEKLKLPVVVAHSIFDPVLGKTWTGDFFSHELKLFVSPLRSVFSKHSLLTIYSEKTGEPRAMAFLRYELLNLGNAYLKALTENPRFFRSTSEGYRGDFLLLPKTDSVSNDLSTYYFSGNPRKPFQMRTWGDKCLKSSSNGRWNLLQEKPHELISTRFFSNHPVIGVARSTPMKTSETVSRSHLIFITGYLLLMASIIVFSLSRLFASPIRAFVLAAKAVAKGEYQWEMSIEGHDEFARLAASFNGMIRGLREKKKMARFVSDDVLEAVSGESEEKIKPGGENAVVTVLFSHIQGFGPMSREHPPEEIVLLLNRYFTLMEQEIRAAGGRIDKYIGDAVMAVFREEPTGEIHPVRACRAGMAMRGALERFNLEREKSGLFPISTGIGIASGPVISGRIGSQSGRLDYTVIGNTVNLAARLESVSEKARETHIIVSPSTIKMLKGRGRLKFLERTAIKGRSREFPLYELLGLREKPPERAP